MSSINTGDVIPTNGFGTCQLNGAVEIESALRAAIKAGYRHIDCAYMYFNGKEIGNALQKLHNEGVVQREDLFITSKLSPLYMHSKEDVMECYKIIMSDLQTNYLDLFLIHHPLALNKTAKVPNLVKEDACEYNEATIATVWEAMEELVGKRMVKNIGISNFTIYKTEKLLKTAKIVPAVNQIECHAYLQQPKLRCYLNSKGIAVQAYAVIGSPTRWCLNPNDPILLEDPVLNKIAVKHQATPAQVCIAFILHLGIKVVVKSSTESRIVANYKARELTLTSDDIERLESLDKNFCYFENMWNTMYFDTHEKIWDIEEDKAYQL